MKQQQIIKNLWIIGAWCLIFLSTSAHCDNGAESYKQGVSYSQQGQYQDALDSFLLAQRQGLNSPSLQYNLAVTYYKLGQFQSASEFFHKLSNLPEYSGLAYFNLGLISLKQNEDERAIEWFRRSYKVTHDKKIKSLSKTALDRLGADVHVVQVIDTRAPQWVSEWNGLVSGIVGYDDNVSIVNEDIIFQPPQRLEDGYYEVLATTSTMLSGNRKNGIRFSGSVDVLKYFDYSAFDFTQLHLALSNERTLLNWNTRLGVGIDRMQIGGENFQQIYGLELRGRRDLSVNNRLELRYRFKYINDISPNGIFRYLQGSKHQLRTRLRQDLDWLRLKYTYDFEFNDREDLSVGFTNTQGDTFYGFNSYSPIRNKFSIAASVNVLQDLIFDIALQYRHSKYRNENVFLNVTDNQFLNGTPFTRIDNRFRAGAALTYIVTPDIELALDYKYTKNNSTNEASAYDRNLLSLELNWFY